MNEVENTAERERGARDAVTADCVDYVDSFNRAWSTEHMLEMLDPEVE